MRIPLRTIVFFSLALAFLLLGRTTLSAYDNLGAHQMINRLVLRILWETYAQDPQLKNYVFKGTAALRPIAGASIVQGSLIEESDLPLVPGNMTAAFKTVRSGEKSLTWPEWVEEGGYTAEEPELWQGLRHFLDPSAAAGSPRYLTDLREWALWGVDNAGRLLAEVPRTDAAEWAVEGGARGRFGRNEYSWDRGVEYMRQAFLTTESPEIKDRLYAAAWRALGETLHILADLTVPAHVRNDAHSDLGLYAGLTDKSGSLAKDPYEACLDSAAIRGEVYNPLFGARHPLATLLGRNLEPDILAAIDSIADTENPSSPDLNVRALFQAVAGYTHGNFFSQDTFAGHLGGKAIQPANSLKVYSKPNLEDFQEEGNYRFRTFPGGVKVLMGVKDRASASGWGVNREVALSQAGRLIPLALYSGVKMAEWFIPRVKVTIVVDLAAKRMKGQVAHIPYGPYTDKAPLIYNKPRDWKEGAALYVDGEKQDPGSYSLQVAQGLIDGDLRGLAKLSDGLDHSLELVLDMGGLQVKSDPARIAGRLPSYLPGTTTAAPVMASQILLPRDLGRVVGATVAWSDIVGDYPVMTVTGELKGIVSLRSRRNPDDQKEAWDFALIIPPGLAPGTYRAEMNNYLDYKGPFTVPISIQVAGESPAAPVGMSNVAQASLANSLNSLKLQRESVAGSLTKERQLDLAQARSGFQAQKTQRKSQLEEEIRGYRKTLETAQGPEAEKCRKKLEWATSFLSTIDGNYQRLEEDFLQRHDQKIAMLQRVLREMESWEAAVRTAFRLRSPAP